MLQLRSPDQKVVPLTQTITIGRNPEADVVISHDGVSFNHAVIEVAETTSIKDLSSNGTYIDNVRIPTGVATVLKPGQKIRFNGSELYAVEETTVAPQAGDTFPGFAAISENLAKSALRIEAIEGRLDRLTAVVEQQQQRSDQAACATAGQIESLCKQSSIASHQILVGLKAALALIGFIPVMLLLLFVSAVSLTEGYSPINRTVKTVRRHPVPVAGGVAIGAFSLWLLASGSRELKEAERNLESIS